MRLRGGEVEVKRVGWRTFRVRLFAEKFGERIQVPIEGDYEFFKLRVGDTIRIRLDPTYEREIET